MLDRVKILLLTIVVLLLGYAATRHNLAYQAKTLVSPGLFQQRCPDTDSPYVSSILTTATDGFMTQFTAGCGTCYGYLFQSRTQSNTPSKLTISLPRGSTVRTMLYSARDSVASNTQGLKISVGDSYDSSTTCYQPIYGYSSWITCNGGAVGSYIYIVNTISTNLAAYSGYLEFFELMAFKEQNVTQNAWITDSTPAISGSKTTNFLKTEMKIQTGNISNCFTSDFVTSPFIALQFPAAIPFSVFLAICQIPQTTIVTKSVDFSSNLSVDIYRFGTFVGSCDRINDPLIDAESECNNLVGNIIKITRTCPSPATTCQLGLCGGNVLSDCDCSQAQISAEYVDITRGIPLQIYGSTTPLMKNTKVQVQYYGAATSLLLNKTRADEFPDSISLVCALESLGGKNYCNLNRVFVILDDQQNEIDTSMSSLLNLNTETGILKVQTKNASDIGHHKFTLAARLRDYPKRGYFPFNTPFTIEVQAPLELTPDVPTSYQYAIATIMCPLFFKANFNFGTSSITVNGTSENIQDTYGVYFSQTSTEKDTYISLVFLYEKEDLAGKNIQVILTFTLNDQVEESFPLITATYFIQNTSNSKHFYKHQPHKTDQNGQNTTLTKQWVRNITNFKTNDKISIYRVSMDQKGLMSIKFMIPMKKTINPQFQYDEIPKSNSTLVIDQIAAYLSVHHIQETVQTGEIQEMMGPNFTVIQFDGLILKLQLLFKDSNSLSTQSLKIRDKITLQMKNTQLLISTQNEVANEKTWFKTAILKLRYQDADQTQQEFQFYNDLGITFKTIISSNFVLNLLLAQSMQKLWCTSNILQLILDIGLLNSIILPSNSQTLFISIIGIAQFDLLPSDKITDSIFRIESFSDAQLDPYSDRLALSSYQTSNFIYNMGSSIYITSVALLLTLVLSIVTAFNKALGEFRILKDVTNTFWKVLCPAFFIRLFIELNHAVLLNSFVQLSVSRETQKWADYISVVLCVIWSLSYIILPFVFFIIIWKMKQAGILHKELTKHRFGELYQDFYRSNSTSMMQLLYQVFWMARRVVVVLCIFYFSDTPSIQIGVLIMMAVLQIGYIGSTRPFKDPQYNRLDVINEIFNFISLNVSFSFTTVNSNDDAAFKIGSVFNALIIFMLTSNCSLMLFDQGRIIYQKIKRFFIHRSVKLKVKQNQEWRKKIEADNPQLARSQQGSKSYNKKFTPLPKHSMITKQLLEVVAEQSEESLSVGSSRSDIKIRNKKSVVQAKKIQFSVPAQFKSSRLTIMDRYWLSVHDDQPIQVQERLVGVELQKPRDESKNWQNQSFGGQVGTNLDFPLYKLEAISELDNDEVNLEKAMKEYGLGIDKNVLIEAKLRNNRKVIQQRSVQPLQVEDHILQ